MTVVLLLFQVSKALAQFNGIEVTSTLPVVDKAAVNGDILTVSSKGLIRATVPYDANLFGIVQNQALLIYKGFDDNGKAIARTGLASVNVTDAGGKIYPGDFITSSAIPGKGMKATEAGYVIGQALDGLEGSSGQITVALRIEYNDEGTGIISIAKILGPLGTVFLQNAQQPRQFTEIIKYVAATVAFLGAILLGFITFTRSLTKAVEAIGRNPLARTTIHSSIVLNVILTISLALIGVLAAFIIIKLWKKS